VQQREQQQQQWAAVGAAAAAVGAAALVLPSAEDRQGEKWPGKKSQKVVNEHQKMSLEVIISHGDNKQEVIVFAFSYKKPPKSL
jgi:hypothetical protein